MNDLNNNRELFLTNYCIAKNTVVIIKFRFYKREDVLHTSFILFKALAPKVQVDRCMH